MQEILKKYLNQPLDDNTIMKLKAELENAGYSIQSIDASSDTNSLVLQDGFITRFIRVGGMWEEVHK